MDERTLKLSGRVFGRDVIIGFAGDVDITTVLPYYAARDVREEVRG